MDDMISSAEFLGLGWLVGLLIAMPVGAVAAMTIKRTLQRGWLSGAATGMGAATADTIYAAIAAFGVYAVQEFLIGHQYTLRVLGGVALIFVGARMFFQKPKSVMQLPDDGEDPDAWHRVARAFLTGLLITLTNPLTLIAFLTIFTNFGLTSEMQSYKTALIFVAGAFLGAASWWMALVGGVVLVKGKISDKIMTHINHALAIFLLLAGAYAVLTGVFEKPISDLLGGKV